MRCEMAELVALIASRQLTDVRAVSSELFFFCEFRAFIILRIIARSTRDPLRDVSLMLIALELGWPQSCYPMKGVFVTHCGVSSQRLWGLGETILFGCLVGSNGDRTRDLSIGSAQICRSLHRLLVLVCLIAGLL